MRLDHRVTFEAYIITGRDRYGASEGDWQPQFTTYADLDFSAGIEIVVAAHTEGRQRAVMTIRDTAQAQEVKASWRVMHKDALYNLTEPPHPASLRGFLSMKIESKA